MPASDLPEFEAGDDTVIWRYMTLERFRDLLTGQLYFAAAHQFDDPFEGAITDAECAWREQEVRRTWKDEESVQSMLRDLSRAFKDLRRMTKVNCWHAATSENVGMWERYLRDKKAGVAVRSTVGALKRSLGEFRVQPSYGEERIVVGRVRYIDFAAHHLIHHTMLETFLYKRIEYRDEQEVRAILSLKTAVDFGIEIPDDGVSVGVDLHELTQEVRVSANAGPDVVDEVRAAVDGVGLFCQVTRSALAKTPTY